MADIFGDNEANILDGTSLDDVIKSGAGDDTINGGDGDDFLLGGAGVDTIDGGLGNDIIVAGGGQDFGIEPGQETLTGGSGSDEFRFDADDGAALITDFTIGEDQLNLRPAGVELLSEVTQFDSGSDLVVQVGSGLTITLQGLAGQTLTEDDFLGILTDVGATTGDDVINTGNGADEVINGLDGNDSISAAGGNDHLLGATGDDFLNGAVGDDTLDGGQGNDTLVAGAGQDLLRGGKGDDIFRFGANDGTNTIIDFTLGEDKINLRPIGAVDFATDVTITDNGVDTTVVVGSTTIILEGVIGVDGGDFLPTDGDDVISTGDNADEVINGRAGDDSISAGGGNDTLVGGDGNDFLNGAADNDTLVGDDGNDTLVGGNGNDVLTGGAGNDTFRFDANDGSDTITDFVSGEDLINIRAVGVTDFNTEVTISDDGVDTTVTFGSTTVVLEDVVGIDEDDFFF